MTLLPIKANTVCFKASYRRPLIIWDNREGTIKSNDSLRRTVTVNERRLQSSELAQDFTLIS